MDSFMSLHLLEILSSSTRYCPSDPGEDSDSTCIM
jgi:hypothetical protein